MASTLPPVQDLNNDLAALYRDALTAALETVDIPHAATVGWDEKRQQILNQRVSQLIVTLRGVLDADPSETLGGTSLIAYRVAYLRERLAENPPVGYVTHEQARAATDHGASWMEAVAEPRDCIICGPGCCSPVLGVHMSCAGPAAGRTVVSVQ